MLENVNKQGNIHNKREGEGNKREGREVNSNNEGVRRWRKFLQKVEREVKTTICIGQVHFIK